MTHLPVELAVACPSCSRPRGAQCSLLNRLDRLGIGTVHASRRIAYEESLAVVDERATFADDRSQ